MPAHPSLGKTHKRQVIRIYVDIRNQDKLRIKVGRSGPFPSLDNAHSSRYVEKVGDSRRHVIGTIHRVQV